MLNKDKRSIILSMVLGDGCLHKTSQDGYAALTIDHGIAQADYVAWKASLVSKIVGRNINLRQGHKGKSIQFSVCWKRIRSWHKFCYPGGKKQIKRILPFIRHPELAIAIWLMDDGYVEPTLFKNENGDKVFGGARFRIFTNSEPIEDHEYFINWFKRHLNAAPAIKIHKGKTKHYPLLKFTQADSLKIWAKIREHVLQFKSMQYKFRYIEQLYQSKILQPQAASNC